jgi:hypothetical protein
MKQQVKEEPQKKYPRAQKFAKLIKKGRNGQVKFQAYRKTPNFKRSKRSLLKLKRTPKVQIKSVLRQNTWDRYSILKAPCTSERFNKKWKTKIQLFSI